MNRCQSLTTKGTRCRKQAAVYHRHSDKLEYLTCNGHHLEGFKPHSGAQGHPGEAQS